MVVFAHISLANLKGAATKAITIALSGWTVAKPSWNLRFFTQLFPCSFTIITSERPIRKQSQCSYQSWISSKPLRKSLSRVAHFSEETRYIGFSIPPHPYKKQHTKCTNLPASRFHNPFRMSLLPFNLWSSVTIQVIIPRLWPLFGLKFWFS